jgi:hypothetical protein
MRQIKGWRALSRHAGAVKMKGEHYHLNYPNYRKKQRQALLHWAYGSLNI